MAHGTHSLEQMRVHAQEVVKKDFIALPQPERDRLEVEYKTEWMAIRDNASMEANRLRLALYANLLDVNTTADKIDEANWIKNNIEATQVLINTLSPGALHTVQNGVVVSTGEDGVIGPRTRDCIKKLFGIDIPVSGGSTGTPDTPSDSLVNTAGITAALTLSLRRAMENDPRLKDQLGDMGVKLKKEKDPVTGVENEKLIFSEGFENTPEYAQVMKYLDALHLTHSPEFTSEKITDAQRRKKLELYLYFAEEGGNFVMDRKYITYKLINSIYQDLLRDPKGPYQIVKDGKDGNYAIVKSPIERDADYKILSSVERLPANHPYQKIIENGRTHASYLNFARTYNLVEQNHQAFAGKEFLGQATLVRSILERYGITGVSKEHVQDPNLLLADWETVKKQIDDKLKSSNDVRAIEELLYVKDLIEGGEWMNEQGNIQTFREINVYGKGFLEEKKLISDQYPGLEGASGEENIGEMIKNIAKENMFPGIGLAIALWIFGQGKIAGGVLLALFGANVAGGIIDSTQKRAEKVLTPDNLEMIRLMELKYSIKGENAPNGVLDKAYAENERRNTEARTTANRSEFLENPLVLGKVVYEINNNDTLKKLKIDDPATKQGIRSVLSGQIISGDEFNSNIGGKTHTLTDKDVHTAYDILLSQKDEQDMYLGDILVTGDIDKVYHDYNSDWFAFTESGAFDTKIHDTLRAAWNVGSETGKRKELLKVMEEMNSHISTGRVDAAGTAIGYGAGLFDNLSSFVRNVGGTASTLAIGVSTDNQKTKIGDLKTKIDVSTLDTSVKDALKKLLDEYIVLLEKQDDFQELRSTWYNNAGTTLTYYSVTDLLKNNNNNYQELQTQLAQSKQNLTTLKASLVDPLYADLVAEIDKEIQYIERMEREAYLALLNNVTIGDVLPPNTQDLQVEFERKKVEKALGDVHTVLRDSIAVGNTDIFGAANYGIRDTISKFYQEAHNLTINGVNGAAVTGVDLWNEMKATIVSSLSGFPYASSVIGGITVSTLPSATEVISNTHLLDRTAADIEAEIKLKIVQKYLREYKETLANLKLLQNTYQTANQVNTPTGNPTILSPEIERLLGGEYTAVMNAVKSQIGTYIASYKGKDMKTMIDTGIVPTDISPTSLQNFETVTRFIENAQDYDDVIRDIKAQAASAFGDASFLDPELPLVSDLKTAFEAKKTALRSHVESAGVLEDTAGMSVTQINNTIATLEQLKTIMHPQTVIIEQKITAIQVKLLEIAKVNDLPDIMTALHTDISTLETRIDELRAIINKTPEEEKEFQEKTALLLVLINAKDTNILISELKNKLQSYRPDPSNATLVDFNPVYYATLAPKINN